MKNTILAFTVSALIITSYTQYQRAERYSKKAHRLESMPITTPDFDTMTLNPLTKGQTVYLGDSITDRAPLDGCGLNRGVPGATSRDIVAHLDQFSKLEPKRVVLMIGTNDVLANIPLEESRQNIKAIMDAFPTTLLEIPPLRDARYIIRGLEFNAMIREFGAKPMPVNESNLMPDGIHLTPNGYKVWRAVACPNNQPSP